MARPTAGLKEKRSAPAQARGDGGDHPRIRVVPSSETVRGALRYVNVGTRNGKGRTTVFASGTPPYSDFDEKWSGFVETPC